MIVAKDFAGNKVGCLNYCYLSIPTNINDLSDKEYYEEEFNRVTAEEAEQLDIPVEEYRATKDINYIPHKTIGEYEWSYPAYFLLSGNDGSGTPTLSSNGLDYPVSLVVLPPGQMSDEDGDIYDRVYEVQTSVKAQHIDIENSSEIPDWRVWIDRASMIASIEAEPTEP